MNLVFANFAPRFLAELCPPFFLLIISIGIGKLIINFLRNKISSFLVEPSLIINILSAFKISLAKDKSAFSIKALPL